MELTDGTGEASGSGLARAPASASTGHTSTANLTRTRGDLERRITLAEEPLKVKTELMDTTEPYRVTINRPATNSSDVIDIDLGTDFLDDVFDPDANTDRNTVQDSSKNISSVFGRGYLAAKTARRAVSSLRQLNPTPCRTELVGTGSFLIEGDDRIRRTKLANCLTSRISTSRSFDPATGSCVSCLGGGHKALVASGGGVVAFIASDQCFPACLPVPRGGGECLRVVRVEDGSLRDITLALADSIGKAILTSGTVVCLGSASHLASVGTAQYIQDWVRSRWWIRERLGEATMVLPLAPIPVAGIQGRSLVRSLIEVTNWFLTLESTECILTRNVHNLFLSTYLARGTGEGWANERLCFRLPVSLDSHVYVNTVSEGWGSRPDGIPPLSQAAEEELVGPLLKVLKNSFGIELCQYPCFERDMAVVKERVGADLDDAHYLVLGGSHASRLANSLGSAGAYVDRVTAGGWKVNAANVTSMLEKVGLTVPRPDYIVLQMLDNSSYFCLSEEGTLSLPAVLDDGRHHIQGQLRLANKEQTIAILKLITPVLKVQPDVKKFLVTCLPRYISATCCGDPLHWNGTGKAEKLRLLSELSQMKRTIRSYLFTEKVPNVTLVDPVQICGANADDAFVDAVHLTPECYDKLAEHLMESVSNAGWDNQPTDEPVNKKARLSSRGGWSRGRGDPARGGRGRGNRGGRRGWGGQFSSSL